MDYTTFERWEKREMPSPMTLMRIVRGTSTPSQNMYYAMMGMEMPDFKRAEGAVKAMDAIIKGGMEDLMAADIDDACKAITSGRLTERFDDSINKMASKLSYVNNACKAARGEDEDDKKEKAPKDKDKDKDEDMDDKAEAPKVDSEEEPKEEAEVEAEEKAEDPVEEVAVESEEMPDAPVEETSAAPSVAPPIDIRAMMAGPAQAGPQVAVDPELVMKALQMLQAIGALC